jgi:hypothetical protein
VKNESKPESTSMKRHNHVTSQPREVVATELIQVIHKPGIVNIRFSYQFYISVPKKDKNILEIVVIPVISFQFDTHDFSIQVSRTHHFKLLCT